MIIKKNNFYGKLQFELIFYSAKYFIFVRIFMPHLVFMPYAISGISTFQQTDRMDRQTGHKLIYTTRIL